MSLFRDRRRSRVAATAGVAALGFASLAIAVALGAAHSRAPAAAPVSVAASFVATADAYVRADAPTKNFGNAKTLSVRSSPIVRTYLRFDLSGLEGAVTAATLRLNAETPSNAGYEVRGVAVNTWGEKSITYANAPAFGSTVGSSGAVSPGVKAVDVTSLVTGNGLVSFAVTTTGATELTFTSREPPRSAPPPELVVDTAPAPDLQPPETTIVGGPSGTVGSSSAGISFTSSEPGSTFACALDAAPFAACSSPRSYTNLPDGPHTFAVRATDAAGNVDQTPASRSWSVDTTPPDTSLDGGPTGVVGTRAASFSFSAAAGSTFQCSLDDGPFAACSSPTGYAGLAEGAHGFSVRAVDAVGNVDPTPSTRTWTVDLTPPETAIDSGPSGTVQTPSATFAFSTADPGAGFECALDGEAFAACTSPTEYGGLADGPHTFSVRARDGAGNLDATAATRAWIIDASPPETTIESGPSSTYRSGSAGFALAATEGGATFECSLDGAPFEPCGQTPTFHVANGSHELGVRATDAAGSTDSSPAGYAWWADALLQNGNFETPSRGWAAQGYAVPAWATWGGSATVVGNGFAGDSAGRVTASAAGGMAIESSPRALNSTVAGRTYTARGSVRSATPGESVCLQVREWADGAQVGAAQSCRVTTGSWATFSPVAYAASRSGSELDVQVHQDSSAAGESFDVDGLSLEDGRPLVVAPPPAATGDPVLLGAGDVSPCWSSGDEAVSRLIDTLPGTLAVVGDSAYNSGSADEFSGCYDPSWGRHVGRTMPAVGDHEYGTPGAAGYFGYFGARGGESGKGWYSYERGAWHIVVLNSDCDEVGGCGPGSEQYAWLRQDLAEHAGTCVGAYFHEPRFSAGAVHGSHPDMEPFWNLLYGYGAEWVLGGDDHNYQRFAPQSPSGQADPAGIRQFVVGTGGAVHYALGPALPNTEAQATGAFGVLELTLHPNSYDWRFVPQEGKTFTDSGTAACSALDTQPPETTIDSGPNPIAASPTATFGFSAGEPGSSFKCSLDGAAFTACSSPKTYVGLANGEHTVRVRATDGAGNVDPTPAMRTWIVAATNLLSNGSFEPALTGWAGYRSTLSAASGGPDGSQFAHVALSAAPGSYSIFTSPRPITSPAPGSHYEIGGWTRTDIASAKVCLRIREWSGTTAIGGIQTCRTPGTTWQRFDPVVYTAAGGSSIDVYAFQSGTVTTGDNFDVDGVALFALP